jgi:hypothetical protein
MLIAFIFGLFTKASNLAMTFIFFLLGSRLGDISDILISCHLLSNSYLNSLEVPNTNNVMKTL